MDAFKSTYKHCLLPVEGMNAWPEDDREPLTAPGYIKMPGRPRTERRREAHEPAKPSKASKFGTKVRCRTCKQVGHNKSSCHKHNPAQTAGGSSQQVATPSHNLVLSNTPQSCAQSRKRKATGTLTTTTSASQSKATKPTKKVS